MRHGDPTIRSNGSADRSASEHVASYLSSATSVIGGLSIAEISEVIHVLEATRVREGTVWTLGNGGNATIAAHLSLGLSLNARRTAGSPLRAVCLTTDGAQLTAAVNDFGPIEMIAAQLAVSARPGDAAVALSVSGESTNVVRALETARELGVTTIGLVGRGDSPVGRLCDYTIDLGSSEPGLAEDAAQVAAHALYGWFMRPATGGAATAQLEQVLHPADHQNGTLRADG